MTDEGPQKRRREYDDRAHRVRRLITELSAEGFVPRVVELDGLYVELSGREPSRTVRVQTTGQQGTQVPDLGNGNNATNTAPQPTSAFRSYRTQAREDLRRRIRENS